MDTKTKTLKADDLSGDLFAESGAGGAGTGGPANPTSVGGDDSIDISLGVFVSV